MSAVGCGIAAGGADIQTGEVHVKRAAVIGLGDISFIHLGAIERNDGIDLCAACDIDETVRERAPESVSFYTDYGEMIERERPDCVHVCLPHWLHYPVTRRAVELGVNVFCEKPLAIDAAEAAAFSELERAHPEVKIGIDLQNRLNESVEALKAIIASGERGAVTGIRGSVPWWRPEAYYTTKPWRGKWATAGSGTMMNQSIHTLDLMYFLAGPVKSLRGSMSQICGYDIEVEDTVACSLEFSCGAHGFFEATNANFKNESVQLAVDLEGGRFLIRDNRLIEVSEDGSETMLVEDAKLPGAKFYYGASSEKLIARFYRALEGEGDAYVHVHEAEPVIHLIDAIKESSRFGRAVELSV